jgi:hypothetical protein
MTAGDGPGCEDGSSSGPYSPVPIWVSDGQGSGLQATTLNPAARRATRRFSARRPRNVPFFEQLEGASSAVSSACFHASLGVSERVAVALGTAETCPSGDVAPRRRRCRPR